MQSVFKFFAIISFAFLGACALDGTRLIQTWTNPDTKAKPLHFSNVLVLAIAPSETDRRTAEDAIVKRIGAKGVPSYQTLESIDLKNIPDVKSRIQKSGADGVILLRWLGERDEKEVYATPMYSPLWDQYTYSWSYWQEEDVVNWRVLRLETRIYSTADEKLLWSGMTETVEPPSVPKLIKELGSVVSKELTKQGLLASPVKAVPSQN